MASKTKTISRTKTRAGENPDGVWLAVTRMIEDPKFTAKVGKSGKKALACFKLHNTEVKLLSKVASEGVDKLFEGNPGRSGKALASYMGGLRSKVNRKARASLNDATFRRYLDPMRLHGMHINL